MKIFPAIDIEDGHCVRLKQGKIQDLTVYGDDPVKMALKWESLGAKYLHVVDLDGAFKGNGVNTEVIHRICQAVKIPVEVGGGIRTEQAIKRPRTSPSKPLRNTALTISPSPSMPTVTPSPPTAGSTAVARRSCLSSRRFWRMASIPSFTPTSAVTVC